MPKRFILRFRGKGPRPAADAERVASLKNTRVIDDTSRMMLVEGPEEDIRGAFASEDWLVTPETSIENPVERPRIKKKP